MSGIYSDKQKKAFWKTKMEEWRKSGKSPAEFCRDNGLNANTFSSWKRVFSVLDDQVRQHGRRQKQLDSELRFAHNRTTSPSFVDAKWSLNCRRTLPNINPRRSKAWLLSLPMPTGAGVNVGALQQIVDEIRKNSMEQCKCKSDKIPK